jgi:t-SNARE complex subunit (syntaxin)
MSNKMSTVEIDVENGLVLLKEVKKRHEDLILVRDKIIKINETWNNLNSFSSQIQITHNQIINDLKVSLNYLSQANADTKQGLNDIRKKRNIIIVIIIIILFFIAIIIAASSL